MKPLNSTTLRPVPPPRFISPRHRVTYHDLQVQSLVQQAFQGIFPQVRNTSSGEVEYYYESPEKTRKLEEAAPLNAEIFQQIAADKLSTGWVKLKALATKPEVPEGVRALLLNFRLPDPERDSERYLTFDNSTGQQEAAILWAFENPDQPFIHIEKVISRLCPAFSLEQSEIPQHKPYAPPQDFFGKHRLKILAGAAIIVSGIAGAFVGSHREKQEQNVAPNIPLIETPFSEPLAVAAAEPKTAQELPQEESQRSSFSLDNIYTGDNRKVLPEPTEKALSTKDLDTNSMILK